MGLKIDDDFKNLIPPLKKDELEKLEKNILKEGIRDKLIVWEKTIIDGHNRYEIAKKHNLNYEVKNLHFLSKKEAINWMINNQLGRRNLTPAQRVDVLFQAEELIKSIYEKGKLSHQENAKETNDKREGRFCSTDQKRKPHNSREEIAKLAETSPATVGRMKKVKREDPESYQEVVEGKKSVYTAYNDLPTVTNKQAKKEGFVKKSERGDVNVSEEKESKDALPSNSQFFRFKADDVTEEEEKELLLNSKNETLKSYINQLSMLLNSVDELETIIKKDISFYKSNITVLDEITNKIKSVKGE